LLIEARLKIKTSIKWIAFWDSASNFTSSIDRINLFYLIYFVPFLCFVSEFSFASVHLIKILWMFQKYCLLNVYYFVRLPASEFMAVAVIIFPSPRIPNGINADCKIGVYAYHWKHKRCTIKMWHEYLSSKFQGSNVFSWTQRVVSNYFSSLSCMRRISLGGKTREYKAFRINHIFIIFTLVRGEREIKEEIQPKWQGFSWIYSTLWMGERVRKSYRFLHIFP
jgi:hypothetical protein